MSPKVFSWPYDDNCLMCFRTKRIHDAAATHALLNILVLILELVNIGMRNRYSDHYWRDGWILSLLSIIILAVSGWLGQEMVSERGCRHEAVEY